MKKEFRRKMEHDIDVCQQRSPDKRGLTEKDYETLARTLKEEAKKQILFEDLKRYQAIIDGLHAPFCENRQKHFPS